MFNRFPLKYELMIANPPWITASMLNVEHKLDNAIYDPKETFLKAIFAFACKFCACRFPNISSKTFDDS